MPMQPIDLPPPFGGVNDQFPISVIQPPMCQQLFNFNTTDNGVSIRNGDSKYKSLTQNSGGNIPVSMVQYGDSNLLLLTYRTNNNNIEVFDVDSASVIYSSVLTGASSFFTPVFFRNYLFMFEPGNYKPGFYFDGTTCGAMASISGGGYTDSTRTFDPVGGNAYRSRCYMIKNNSASYWYSGVNLIAGDLKDNYVDLTGEVAQACTLILIGSITLADTVSAVIYQAFVFSNGDVNFYSGSYPNSDDWTLVGKSKIGQPLSYRSIIQYQGDSLVLCDSGVVSLRDLFLKGAQDAITLSVNGRIQQHWKALIQTIRTQYSIPNGLLSYHINGIVDNATNRIIISLPFYLDSSGVAQIGSFYFVFDTLQQSWNFQRSFGIGANTVPFDLANYKNINVFAALGTTKIMIYHKEGATGFTDRNPNDSAEVGYDFEIISAPINNDKNYASYTPEVVNFARTQAHLQGYVQQVLSMDMLSNSDMYELLNFYWIKDLGVQTTVASLTSGNTGLQKVNYNSGIDGSVIQYRFAGTTATGKTIGFILYGLTAQLTQGNVNR